MPLTLTVILTVALAAVYDPMILTEPTFVTGLWMQAILLGLCAVVPWGWLGVRLCPQNSHRQQHAGHLVDCLGAAAAWPGGAIPELLAKPLNFPFRMMSFSITVVIMTTSMDSQRLALERKDVELRNALRLSRKRETLLETVLDTAAVDIVVADMTN